MHRISVPSCLKNFVTCGSRLLRLRCRRFRPIFSCLSHSSSADFFLLALCTLAQAIYLVRKDNFLRAIISRKNFFIDCFLYSFKTRLTFSYY